MNKKIFYGVFVLLIIGLFVISGCSEVGRRVPQGFNGGSGGEDYCNGQIECVSGSETLIVDCRVGNEQCIAECPINYIRNSGSCIDTTPWGESGGGGECSGSISCDCERMSYTEQCLGDGDRCESVCHGSCEASSYCPLSSSTRERTPRCSGSIVCRQGESGSGYAYETVRCMPTQTYVCSARCIGYSQRISGSCIESSGTGT